MHSKLHGIGIDQQGFLEAQQDSQLYRIYQASDSLYVCVLGGGGGRIQKKKQMDKSSCVKSNLRYSCLFFCYFVQCFETQMLGKESLAILKHVRGLRKQDCGLIRLQMCLNFTAEYCLCIYVILLYILYYCTYIYNITQKQEGNCPQYCFLSF